MDQNVYRDSNFYHQITHSIYFLLNFYQNTKFIYLCTMHIYLFLPVINSFSLCLKIGMCVTSDLEHLERYIFLCCKFCKGVYGMQCEPGHFRQVCDFVRKIQIHSFRGEIIRVCCLTNHFFINYY